MSENLKSKVVKGSIWVVLEQICVQGLNFGMGVVLARLLTPHDYGTVALVTIFLSIAQVLVSSGLGQALVQKKEIDDLDINSVFYLSSVISVLMYGVLFVGAPFIADYYKVDELVPIVRVLAVNLLLYAINSVQNAELYRQMRFDVAFRVSLIMTIASAMIGIGLALMGLGVWALVWSSVLGNVAGVVARAVFISWRPRLIFSYDRIRPLFHYGSRLMANSLLVAFFGNLYGVIIGKFYTREDLAYVNKGQNIPQLLLGQINASLIEVALPALAQMQDERDRMVSAMRRLFVCANIVVMPVMTALAVAAPSLILFFYGEQWVYSTPYMRLMCLLAIWGPMGAINQQGLLAIGKSGVYLKLGVARIVISMTILILCLKHGVLFWMCVNTLLFGPASALLDAYCGSRYLGYRMRDQLRDAVPIALCCIIAAMVSFAFCLVSWQTGAWWCLCRAACEVMSIWGVFAVLAVVFKLEAIREICRLKPATEICERMRLVWLLRYLGVNKVR